MTKFFATCGRGLEKFAKEEVRKFGFIVENTDLEGKIFFNIDSQLQCNCPVCQTDDAILIEDKIIKCQNERILKSLFNLKLVERIFLLIVSRKVIDFEVQIVADELRAKNLESIYQKVLLIKEHHRVQPWIGCIDPNTCPAYLTRQHEVTRKRPYQCEDSIMNSKKHKKSAESVHPATDDHEVLKTFRVSCRLRGVWKNISTSSKITQSCTDLIASKVNWTTDYNNPKADWYINLNDDVMVVAVCLSDKPLSLRSYMSHIPLRAPICSLMVHLSPLYHGCTVMDPMCGTGAILVEAAQKMSNMNIIASDFNCTQIIGAQCNLRKYDKVEFLIADARNIPLQSGLIDCILCDFPFGRKHSATDNPEGLLKSVLFSFARLTKKGGTICLLLSSKQQSYLETILTAADSKYGMSLQASHATSLGFTSCFICLLKRI